MRTEMLKELEDKLVFFDFDGTLSEYRFGGQVGPIEFTQEVMYNQLFNKIYDNIRPLKTMQEYVENLDTNKVYILGAIAINTEINEKYEWLSKYYPSIKKENMIFVNSSSAKLQILEAYREKMNLKEEDIVLVDDYIPTIQKAEELGFIAYHPSSFID